MLSPCSDFDFCFFSPADHGLSGLRFFLLSAAVGERLAGCIRHRLVHKHRRHESLEPVPEWVRRHRRNRTAAQSNQALVNSPSEDGAAHWFSVGGIYPYANSYWYVERTTTTSPPMPPALVTQQSYSFDLWIPSGEDNNPQAIEWETHQQFQGWIYNTGWQALYAGSGDPTKMLMRTFQWNPTESGPAKGWYATGILIPRFSPDAWHHVQTDEHVSGTTIFFDDIIVDGKKYVPSNSSGSTHQAIQGGPKYGDKFNNAIQLDLDNVPMPFDIYIDNMRIAYSTQ